MSRGRLTTLALILWTLGMGAWLILYSDEDATCGPEIYRNCPIGLKVETGLGRPGIVLLWALVLVAVGMTALQARRPAERGWRPAVRIPRLAVRRLGAALAVLLASIAGVIFLFSSTTDERPERGPAGPRVQVVSAVLQPAITPSGRRRHRARVRIGVRFTNRSDRTTAAADPVLLATPPQRPDPRQRSASGALLRPVPPSATAGGTLNFETAGAVTDRLRAARRGRLRFAGETVAFPLALRALRPAAVSARVLSAGLQLAVTRSGRRRARARLSVSVRVVNAGSRTIADTGPVLLAAGRVAPDPAARSISGSLLRPVPASTTAAGILRFETAGAQTRELLRARRGTLRIAGETIGFGLGLRPLRRPPVRSSG